MTELESTLRLNESTGWMLDQNSRNSSRTGFASSLAKRELNQRAITLQEQLNKAIDGPTEAQKQVEQSAEEKAEQARHYNSDYNLHGRKEPGEKNELNHRAICLQEQLDVVKKKTILPEHSSRWNSLSKECRASSSWFNELNFSSAYLFP